MNKNLIDILACPIDKYYPLELFDLKSKNDIIEVGILFCKKCSRFFPIIEEIPIMLPDELRDKDKDISFLGEFKDKIPKEIIFKALPWHL